MINTSNAYFTTEYEGTSLFFNDRVEQIIESSVVTTLNKVIPSEIRMGGREIKIPLENIRSVMENVYANYTHPVQSVEEYITEMARETISIIVLDIKTSMLTDWQNKQRNVWDAVVLQGDNNRYGLRQHTDIKIRNDSKMPTRGEFHMNY